MADENKAGWEYKPDDESGDAGGAGSAERQPAKPKTGKTVAWSASEYIDHQQGVGWFSLLALATATLTVIIYFITHDYFAVAITLLAGLILAVFATKKPRQLSYELTFDGLKIEQKLYPYNIFKSYSIIQDGALMSLSFLPAKKFMPPVSVYFSPADQEKIGKLLEDKLPFEVKNLDPIDRLSRRLRF